MQFFLQFLGGNSAWTCSQDTAKILGGLPATGPTSQQIINPNLLRNASAAQPTAPAADPGFSSSGAKRLASVSPL